MKKYLFLLSALALLGLTSCEVPEINPNYDPVTNSVLTNFIFNVATGNSPQTKQTAATVQYGIESDVNVAFRGIDNAWLLTKKMTQDGRTVATAIQMDDALELGAVLGNGDLKPASTETSDKKSNRILQLALPVNTNTLVFYGKAMRSAENNFNNEGQIVYTPVSSKNLADVNISMVPRLPSGSANATKMEYIGHVIEAALHTILSTELVSGGSYSGGGETAITLSNNLKWSDYAICVATTGENAGKSPVQPANPAGELEKILGRAYVSFTTVTQDDKHGDTPEWNEVRSGAGTAIARQMVDLLAVMNDVDGTSPLNSREAVAKAFAHNFTPTLSSFLNASNTGWAELSEVVDAIPSTERPTAVTITDTDQKDLSKFPASFDLPAGATQIYFETVTGGTEKKFQYKFDNIPLPAMGGKTTSVYKYLYPAELCYFGNSPIRTTNVSSDTYPDGVGAWEADTWTGSWQKDTRVTSSTRSVAMRDNINYSTALMKSTIGYTAGLPTEGTGEDSHFYLLDNNANIPGHNTESDVPNHIPLKASSFKLTGILIGGASLDYDWCFISKQDADHAADNETFIVYDKVIGSTGQGINVPLPAADAASKSEDVFTMVLDNYVNGNAEDQSSVFVALEFLNNSEKDFWGLGNMVRAGGTFYIIGMLDPTAASNASTITWPGNKYALPPYNADGSTIEVPRVFIQDYTTEVNFKLGVNSLQKAYVTVPDLRSSKIQLGLSVDLVWRDGLTFGDVILGQ